MVIGLSIIITTFLYLMIVSIVYFSKPRIKSVENKVYSYLLLISVCNLVLEVGCCFFVAHRDSYRLINEIINRMFLLGLLSWLIIFTFYMVYISFFKNNTFYNKYRKECIEICFLILVILFGFILINPIYYFSNNVYTYSYGPATDSLLVMGLISIIIDLICLIKNYKNIKEKENYPLLILILVMILVATLREINSGIIVINSSFSLITIIMYFTIENPDVKFIGELNRNKYILEKNNEERSNLLFKMTQEVKKPISNIESLVNMIDTEREYVKLEDIVSAIKSNTRQISYIVNDVLDVSNVDVRKIKIENNKYNAKRLFDEINLFVKDKVSENVKYSSSISSELPEYLNGDYIKIKQAIMSILLNSVENTKKGFIELDVSVIVRYDMCRLIVTVEDSGVGMNINKVNDILTLDKPLDETDEAMLANMDVDLNITKKIINIIGGSIMIKSEVDKGTEFIVVIDQKIETDKKSNIKTNYNDSKKRVLIVDDDLDKLNIEKELFIKNDIDAVGTMYGLDVVNKIRTGDKFDYIILDDDTVKGSAKSTLDELKKIPKFDTPVIVMLEENKKMIKDKYKEIGFSDYILKDDIESSINEFIKKMK